MKSILKKIIFFNKNYFREIRSLLEKCAATALNSKLVASHKEFFAKMVVDAVMKLDADLNIDLIGVKKETGGSLEVSNLFKIKINNMFIKGFNVGGWCFF